MQTQNARIKYRLMRLFLIWSAISLARATVVFDGTAEGQVIRNYKSPRGAAYSLVNDRKFGIMAINDSISFGDQILDPLIEFTDDFRGLDNYTAKRVADVLSQIPTTRCKAIGQELYSREQSLARFVGAVAVARQGGSLGSLNRAHFLIDELYRTGDRGSLNYSDHTERKLAVEALGYSRSADALPALIHCLESLPCSNVCSALGHLKNPRAIPALRRNLQREKAIDPPGCLNALFVLGDSSATSLAIGHIRAWPNAHKDYRLVAVIECASGMRFGNDLFKLENWWRDNNASWRVAEKCDCEAAAYATVPSAPELKGASSK